MDPKVGTTSIVFAAPPPDRRPNNLFVTLARVVLRAIHRSEPGSEFCTKGYEEGTTGLEIGRSNGLLLCSCALALSGW